MDRDNISVIIRTKNEERYVGYCIQSILDILHKPEIIIIDNNSTDETLNIVKSFRQDPTLKTSPRSYTNVIIHSLDNYTPGKALNQGVKLSSQKYILFISAHCVLKVCHLSRLYNLISTQGYVGVFGNQIPVWRGRKITKRYVWSNFSDISSASNYYSQEEDRYFFHNALSFFLKKSLKKYPFDEYLISKEDRYWAKKIISAKKRYYYTSNALVAEHNYTVGGATWKGIG